MLYYKYHFSLTQAGIIRNMRVFSKINFVHLCDKLMSEEG